MAEISNLPYTISVPNSFSHVDTTSALGNNPTGSAHGGAGNAMRLVLCQSDGVVAGLSNCDFIDYDSVEVAYNLNISGHEPFQNETDFETDVYGCWLDQADCASAKQSAQPIQGAQVNVPVSFGPVSLWNGNGAFTEFQDKQGNVLTVSVGASSQDEAVALLSQITVSGR